MPITLAFICGFQHALAMLGRGFYLGSVTKTPSTALTEFVIVHSGAYHPSYHLRQPAWFHTRSADSNGCRLSHRIRIPLGDPDDPHADPLH